MATVEDTGESPQVLEAAEKKPLVGRNMWLLFVLLICCFTA